MKPRLFIGSSTEGVNIAYAVQQNLWHSAEVTIWDQGVFQLSESALDSLLKILDNSDFGLFIFSPDDLLTIRQDENTSVRDNVVFELGLFFGRLGKGRCFILTPNDATNLRIPTDLVGIMPGTYEAARSDGNLNAAVAPASHMIEEQIQEIGLAAQRTESPSVSEIPDGQEKILEAEAPTGNTESEDPDRLWVVAYLDDKFDQALDILGSRLEEENDPEEQVRLKAWIGRLKYRSDPNQGTSELQRLIENHPTNANPYFHLAYAHMNRGLYEDSLQVIEDGLGHADDKVLLFEAKASYFSKKGADDKAEETRLDAVRQLADLPDPYLALAEQYQGEERYEDARSLLEDAIKEIPDNERLLSQYSSLINDHFEAKQALPYYDDLISMSPTSQEYRTRRGNIFLLLDLNNLAMRDYKRASELAYEKRAWILANIGNLFKNRGFYEEGIAYLKRALEINPEDDYAHERLAITLKLRNEERKKANEIRKEIVRSTAERKRTQEEAPPGQT